MADKKNEIDRREFLKTSAMGFAAGKLPISIKAGGTTAITKIAGAVTGATPVHKLIDALVESFIDLDNVENSANACFQDLLGVESAPKTSDEFFAQLTQDIDGLYNKGSVLASNLRQLQSLKSEANAILKPALEDYNAWDVWSTIISRQTTISLVRQWVADSQIPAQDKVKSLQEFFHKCHSFITKDNPIDWNKPTEEILATIDQKFAALEPLHQKPPQEIIKNSTKADGKFINFMCRYFFDRPASRDVYRKLSDNIHARLDDITEKHHLGEGNLFSLINNDELELLGANKIPIRLSIHESPKRVQEAIEQSVYSIPSFYPCAESPLPGGNFDRKVYAEILKELPGFIDEIVPKMAAKYFSGTQAAEKEDKPKEKKEPGKSYIPAVPYIDDDTTYVRKLQEDASIKPTSQRKKIEYPGQQR